MEKRLFALFVTIFSLLAPFPVYADDDDDDDADEGKEEQVDYRPKLNGTIRAKYEYQPQISAGRFQVRNARVSITGNVHKTVSYKAEIDLSDEGKIKMLDAFARWKPIDGGSFTIGQMRVPFTIDAHRSPHQQYFANRSFIAKQVGNVRDVAVPHNHRSRCVQRVGAYRPKGLLEQPNQFFGKGAIPIYRRDKFCVECAEDTSRDHQHLYV